MPPVPSAVESVPDRIKTNLSGSIAYVENAYSARPLSM